jgi:hypothetical protein
MAVADGRTRCTCRETPRIGQLAFRRACRRLWEYLLADLEAFVPYLAHQRSRRLQILHGRCWRQRFRTAGLLDARKSGQFVEKQQEHWNREHWRPERQSQKDRREGKTLLQMCCGE